MRVLARASPARSVESRVIADGSLFRTTVVRLTTVPDEPPDHDEGLFGPWNARPYAQRGWPTFEMFAARLAAGHRARALGASAVIHEIGAGMPPGGVTHTFSEPCVRRPQPLDLRPLLAPSPAVDPRDLSSLPQAAAQLDGPNPSRRHVYRQGRL